MGAPAGKENEALENAGEVTLTASPNIERVYARIGGTEYLSLEDGNIAFQCSDGFGAELLCGAYDVLDESLAFQEWHNH